MCEMEIDEDKFQRRWIKNQYGLSLEEYERLKGKALAIKKEEDIQQHLHGEITTTNPESIAIECYLKAYQKGKWDYCKKICDMLGIDVEAKREELKGIRWKRSWEHITNEAIKDAMWENDKIKDFFELEMSD